MHYREDACRLPPSAQPAELIVCEPAERWSVVLGGAAGLEPPIHQTRSIAECWEALERAPASFVVVEVTEGNVEVVLRRMACLERDFPLARVAAVVGRRLAGCEWLLRESGAVHVGNSTRCVKPLVDLIRRHFSRAPEPKRSLAEKIRAALPWAGHRSRPPAKHNPSSTAMCDGEEMT